MEVGELRGIADFRCGLVSADRIVQVDNAGRAITELDIDQVVTDVMRSSDAKDGRGNGSVY